MGKPSIFSREYEKQMKKRKRNILIFSLLAIILASVIAAKFIYSPIDFTKVKQNLQAWIDSDTDSNDANINNTDQDNKDQIENPAEIIEQPKEEAKETFIDIKLASGNTGKAIYKQEAENKMIFAEVKELEDGVTYDISPSKNKIIINDVNGNITLYNIDGSSLTVSKNEYISTRGTVFTKEDTLANNPSYLWNYNAKFISDDKIVFITNRPYFGTNVLEQYLWITDIPTGNDNVIWDLSGSNIELSTIQEKGLQVTVDGNVYFLDQYGNYNQ